jgi:hypothetical protein
VSEIKESRELGGSSGERPKFWVLGVARSEVAKCQEPARGTRGRTARWAREYNQPNTHHTFGGVNNLLTYRISRTREIIERRFEPSTRKVARSENERRKVKSPLSGVRERKGARLDV